MKSALVLLNGQPPCKPLMTKLWKQTDFHLAADGGANLLLEYGLNPDLIIGDLDSIKESTKIHFTNVPTLKVTDQNKTDAEKSLDYLLKNDFQDINIAGGTGKRLDHTLYLLALLKKYFLKDLSIRLWNEDEELFLINKSCNIKGLKGQRISFFALEKPIEDLSVKGAEFSFKHRRLETGAFSSISNRFEKEEISFQFNEGWLLISLQHQLTIPA